MKLKIFLTLLIPFILCGIGLLSVINELLGKEMDEKQYLIGLGVGVLIWYLETTIIVSIIERYVNKTIK
jgi:hypothetical protein